MLAQGGGRYGDRNPGLGIDHLRKPHRGGPSAGHGELGPPRWGWFVLFAMVPGLRPPLADSTLGWNRSTPVGLVFS